MTLAFPACGKSQVGPTETACPEPPAATTAADPSEHDLDHEIRIFDAEGHERSLPEMLDALAEHRVVLLGETHLDDVTHRVELAVLEGLARRHEDKVVLSMEMFERDVQAVLDDYLAGRIDEPTLLAKARPWGNYRTDYRPLIESARARALPVVAANTPRPVLRKATRGAEAYAKVRAEHPEWLPAEVFPASDAYWARVDRTIRGHGPPSGGDRTYAVQNLWDNTMADAIVSAAKAHPEHTVLHVVGGFHVDRHDGTAAQIRKRAPKLDQVTLEVVPTDELAWAEPSPERADFVVYTRARAEGPSGDQLSVAMPAKLDYRLHLPDGPVPEGGWPLLVWLGEDDTRPDDDALRWRLALGQQAAVIVVEPPHRTRAREGWTVRRWDWPQSRGEDFGRAASGLWRILEYARRRLPVRTDPVLVAGEGMGGTLALWAAQYGSHWKGIDVLAIAPELPRDLRTAAIPEAPSGARSITVLGELDEGTLAGLRGAGLQPKREDQPPLGADRTQAVREALGVAKAPSTSGDASAPDPLAPMARRDRPLYVRLQSPSSVSRVWAAQYVALLREHGQEAHLVIDPEVVPKGTATLAFDGARTDHAWLASLLADGRHLPRSPDPFGGAVVLLLPSDAPKGAEARWEPVVAKAEAAQGVFKSPIRIVREGDRALPGVLAELREKGSTEVLVVPLELCATGARMQRYFGAVASHAEGLSLHWMPGLGMQVVRAATDAD